MIEEMFYTSGSLYIFLKGDINKKTISSLKNRMFYIIDEYGIKNIIIDIKNVSKIDDCFYDILDTYDSKYSGNLKLEMKKTDISQF